LVATHQLLKLLLFSCIGNVAPRMRSNRMRLNTSKAEVLWWAPARSHHQPTTLAVQFGTDQILPSSSLHKLSVYLDGDVSMFTRVTHMVSTCFSSHDNYASYDVHFRPILQTDRCVARSDKSGR
jgi:hypothetical protein